MDRCRLLVEGQTEETFVNQTLAPHLYALGFHEVVPVVVATKRIASGGKHAGGIGGWEKLRNDIRLLLRDSGALVTTMVDFYGLPPDVPGMTTLDPSWDAPRRVGHVEAAISDALGDPGNFDAHVMMHEFEALLYSDPDAVGTHFGDDGIAAAMEADLVECGEPELVDNGPDTAPSKRVGKHRPGYLKTTDGPTILDDIGLPALRNRCPHFDAWLERIEGHAP